MEVNDDGLTFKEWMRRVDQAVGNILGMGLSTADLSDWHYWDAWSDGASPKEAAEEAMEADDLFGAMY